MPKTAPGSDRAKYYRMIFLREIDEQLLWIDIVVEKPGVGVFRKVELELGVDEGHTRANSFAMNTCIKISGGVHTSSRLRDVRR